MGERPESGPGRAGGMVHLTIAYSRGRFAGLALAGAAALAVALTAGASAYGSPAIPAPAPDEWQGLTVRPIAQGSGTGAWSEPAATLERVDVQGQPAPGPKRINGLAGTNLNQAMAAAGVPNAVAQDYLRAISSRIALANGISVEDRFDIVIDTSGGSPRLLYAGLDRVGASDVQLMRWTEDGKAGWVDANGIDAAAEAMRTPVSGRVSSGFGMRYHPILGRERFHKGVDLAVSFGTPIHAAADGRVTFAGWVGGYGRQVRIGHADGLATAYGHMSRIAAAPGELVHRGDVIGYVGSSGLSTGPHLHYEVFKNGRPVNPMTVRYVGGTGMERQERHAFNDRLRALLTGRTG
ncbi:M23 family metallopeptidase [Sphingomonas alba]|uniref:M23 family metallopeptidase n=1 Tax=Sphingomonas alba TaxID=2908208 RepID=A0ABT0RPC6_9SPHN|nr:M23 family metallopeptidase [Sphingomonas alba]MCL6684496.1 M23 family metallopeptidase [Sphingomonas alba]